jgi:glycerophosphoryl diester phosphodiesterase
MTQQYRSNGVTGHRGNGQRAPENTLEGFASGIGIGCDMIETDVHLTADGALILCHNFDTEETCGEKLVIAESTAAQLRALDASYGFRQRTGLNCYPVTRMPLLEEALEMFRSFPGVRLSIQPKMQCLKEVFSCIRRMGMEKQVAFNDGNLEYMIACAEEFPEAPVFYDLHHAHQVDDAIKYAKKCRFHGIVLNLREMTPELAAAISEAGFEPGVWTVNGTEQISKYLAMGVKRVYSDTPEEALKIINNI